MSSPFSMLKKTQRSALQGSLSDQWEQNLPLRRNLVQESEADLVTSDSSDQTLDSSHISANDVSTSNPEVSLNKERCQPGSPPCDHEVTSVMAQRLALLEKIVETQALEIERKEKVISILEEKLRAQEKSVKTHYPGDREDLERKLQKLQKQVDEMEDFLSDYDLIWVGNEQTSSSVEDEFTDSSDVWQPGTSAGGSFHINFDLLLQRIKELNVVAGEGECFVQTTLTGAKLSKRDPVPLSLYSNGMVMFDGPFRSYWEPGAQQCIQDLMDGYFPTELQRRFPEGMSFEVHDKRHEEFIDNPTWVTFPGEGQDVHGEKDESSNVVSFQLPGRNLTTEKFLSKLPKVVVRAGKVIDVRNSLRTLLKGSSDTQSSLILINRPALQATSEREQTLNTEKLPPGDVVITLKVKSEDGNHTYMVKMCLSETVGDLRNHLDKHRGSELPDYNIISAFPKRCFSDDRETLQSCGLLTNTTLLLLRKRQQSQRLTLVNKLT